MGATYEGPPGWNGRPWKCATATSGLDFPKTTAAWPDLQFRRSPLYCEQPVDAITDKLVARLISMREARDG